MGDMWDLQGWYTEWEMNGRYVGLTGVVYRTSEAICNESVLTMETVPRLDCLSDIRVDDDKWIAQWTLAEWTRVPFLAGDNMAMLKA